MDAYLHCLSHTPLVGFVDPEQAVLDEVNGEIHILPYIFPCAGKGFAMRVEEFHPLIRPPLDQFEEKLRGKSPERHSVPGKPGNEKSEISIIKYRELVRRTRSMN